nr:diguanylate cyclase [Chloroflexota bacterium]
MTATFGLFAVQRSSDHSRRGEILLARVRAQANRLAALEWEAIADQSIEPELSAEVATTRIEFEQTFDQLTLLSPTGENTRQIRAVWDNYNAWVDNEFKLIESGQIAQAKSMDEEYVDPAFAALDELLGDLDSAYLSQGEQARAINNVSSVSLTLGTGLTIGLLLWRYRRVIVRAEVLHAEQRTLHQSVEHLRRLNETSNLLQNCHSAQEAYAVVARAAQRLFPDMAGALYVRNAAQDSVEMVTEWGIQTESDRRLLEPGHCWALQLGRLHLVEDSRTGWQCHHLSHPYPATYLCVPLLTHGETLGMLTLQPAAMELSPDNGHRPQLAAASPLVFDAAGQQLAQAFVVEVELVLANLRLLESIYQQSVRDHLTGLFNRRYLEETLERELHRAGRAGHALSIIMLDIDHFKDFNDSLGHAAGDALLQELGKLLNSHFRGADLVCRYGGEEFVAVLPEASLENTRQRAEALREAVKKLDVRYRNRKLGPISISLGIATARDQGTMSEEVLRAADAALYRAKQAGRDRVE